MMDEELEWDEGTVTLCRVRAKRRWLFGGMQREKWKMGMERYGGWDSGPALWRCTLS